MKAAVQNVEGRIKAPLLAALNEQPFRKTGSSRRRWFEDLDRPALTPLPAERYEYAEWRKA